MEIEINLGLGYWWMQVDSDGMPTGHICSAFYGDNDKPMEGNWILVRNVT